MYDTTNIYGKHFPIPCEHIHCSVETDDVTGNIVPQTVFHNNPHKLVHKNIKSVSGMALYCMPLDG